MNVIFIEKTVLFFEKIKTFLSDPKLLNGSVYQVERHDTECNPTVAIKALAL